VVLSTLSEAAPVYLDGEVHAGRNNSHLVFQPVLELLHNILKRTSGVVRSALQVRPLTPPRSGALRYMDFIMFIRREGDVISGSTS